MLSAVIIILREVLEAALIVSVLLASSSMMEIRRRWIWMALALGLVGASVYAYYLAAISAMFDGAGQEIANTLLNTLLFLALALHNFWLAYCDGSALESRPLFWGRTIYIAAVTLAMVREGAEIIVYLYGYSFVPSQFSTILLGSFIGTGIGLSIGALFYYMIANSSDLLRQRIIYVLVLLVAAGLLSEATEFLLQADLIEQQQPLWDSSNIIGEDSLTGQLLYALLAYEATPTRWQLVAYLGGFVFIMLISLLVRKTVKVNYDPQ